RADRQRRRAGAARTAAWPARARRLGRHGGRGVGARGGGGRAGHPGAGGRRGGRPRGAPASHLSRAPRTRGRRFMIPDVVVDVGNTRIKWGWCSETGLRETVALPAEMPDVWEEQRRTWGLLAPACWVVASVHPARRDRLVSWLHDQ